jgi:hypothetical protein
MRQIPDVTKGSYKEKPSNVIWQYGEYYTRGTQPWYSYYWNQDSQDDSGSDDEDDDSNTGKDKKKDKDEEDSDEWVKQWLEEN